MAGSKTIITPVNPEPMDHSAIKNGPPKMPMTPTQPEPYHAETLLKSRSKPTVLGPTAPGGADQ